MKRIEKHLYHCLDGDLETIQKNLYRAAKKLDKPLDYWVPLILSIGGGESEVFGYQKQPEGSHKLFRTLLKSTASVLIKKLVKAHPEIKQDWQKFFPESQVRKLKFKAKQQSELDESSWCIQFALTDAETMREWCLNGYFDWDDGDFLLSWAIAIGWSQILDRKAIKPAKRKGMPAKVLAFELFRFVAKKHDKHPLAHWLLTRYQLSWMPLRNTERDNLLLHLNQKSNPAPALLRHSTAVALGIKYKDAEVVKKHGSQLRKALGKNAPNASLAVKAWEAALKGSKTAAKAMEPLSNSHYASHIPYMNATINSNLKKQ